MSRYTCIPCAKIGHLNFKSQVLVGGRLLLSWLPACHRGLPWLLHQLNFAHI